MLAIIILWLPCYFKSLYSIEIRQAAELICI